MNDADRSTPEPTSVFLTGATGLIGLSLAARLTGHGHRVHALVRGAAARAAKLAAWINAHGGRAANLVLVDGDLAQPALGLSPSARDALSAVRFVFHAGAAMQWGQSKDQARAVNVGGTDQVLELAASLPDLRRFVQISGFGVALFPDDRPVTGGAYAVTKIESDRRVRAFARSRGLAITRVHPGNVIGDSRTGEATRCFGLGDLVRRVVTRAMPAIPGGPKHWVPLVAVDYLAAFLARVPFADTAPAAEYFVLDDRSPDLATLVRDVARTAGVPAPRVRVPVWAALAAARAMGDVQMGEALHLLPEIRFDTGSAVRAACAQGLEPPDIALAIERSVTWMLRHDFGARCALVAEHRRCYPAE